MGGSIGLIAAARMAMVVGKHPHDPDRRVLAMFKSDLSARARSLDFILADGALTWDANAPDIAPEELLHTPSEDEKSALEEAAEFLADYLTSGPANAAEVLKAARANGIADPTLKRAKKRLNVQTTKTDFKDSSWAWRLPIQHATPKGTNVSGDPLRDATPKGIKIVVDPLRVNIKKNVSQAKPVAPLAREVGEL